MCVGTRGGQERALDPLELGLQVTELTTECGCRGQSSGPVEEHQALLNTELSPQPCNSHALPSCLSQE